jgi:uncharacterized protein with PQ loop repeat
MTHENWILIGLIAQTLGSVLLLGGYAPQIIKLHRTKIPTGISLLFWTMIAVGCTSILINMIIQSTAIEVMITQGLNALGAWYTLFLVIYCRVKRGEKITPNIFVVIVAVVIIALMIPQIVSAPTQDVGYMFQGIGTVALLTAYIPQIIYLFQVKDATGISRWLFIVLGLGLLCVTGNMIITGTSVEIIITEFVNIALILVQYFMTVHYQRKNN